MYKFCLFKLTYSNVTHCLLPYFSEKILLTPDFSTSNVEHIFCLVVGTDVSYKTDSIKLTLQLVKVLTAVLTVVANMTSRFRE